MSLQTWQRGLSLAESDMVKAMCLELSQTDFKAIGRSRGFEPETIGSRELTQHVFLSEQGVTSAVQSLTPVELAGLHLLNCLQEDVSPHQLGAG